MTHKLNKSYKVVDFLKRIAKMPFNVCPDYDINKQMILDARSILDDNNIKYEIIPESYEESDI